MHEHDRGLEYDLATLRSRRRILALFGGAGIAVVAGCSSGAGQTGAAGSTGAAGTSSTAGPPGTVPLAEIPAETGGPFPGDGSNGPNVLSESGIVRSDIRSSIGSGTAVAEGVPLTISLTVLEADTAAPLAGAAIYLWHCDREGRYSMYSSGVTGENYLRGVQAAGSTGKLAFTSVFPAAYSGRWPHVHFEIYPNLAAATTAGGKLITSQLALPEDVCREVYATAGYTGSGRNLAATSLATDMVFRDGYDHQLATVTGDISAGFTAALEVAV
jgi:protocatechuate 3,4-dioxygenase beta subunit